MSRLAARICLLSVCVLIVLAGSASARQASAPAGTFVSLVPACGCASRSELDLFSTASGRRLRHLVPVSPGPGQQLATPAATRDGRLLFTMTSGERCSARGYLECPKFVPDSCTNTVQSFSPGASGLQTLFKVAGSEEIGQVVPDPGGGDVALSMEPCVSLRGTNGMFVRNIKARSTRPIMTTQNRCSLFGSAAWSRSGTELAFPYQRAGGPPMEMAGGFACSPGPDYLALASVNPKSGSTAPKLIAPPRGCLVKAAGFDRSGPVAAEGCDEGTIKTDAGSGLGAAYLVQYSPSGRQLLRVRLRAGLEQAVVTTEPRTGNVLVTEDQPANQPYPEQDWVWEFNGTRLRLISRYKAHDAAQILAVAW